MELTKELIDKAGEAKSAQELIALAEENDMELTKEEAEQYFAQFHQTGELTDEELDNVSGGGCKNNNNGYDDSFIGKCYKCRSYGIRIYVTNPYSHNGTFTCSNCKQTWEFFINPVHYYGEYRLCPKCHKDGTDSQYGSGLWYDMNGNFHCVSCGRSWPVP